MKPMLAGVPANPSEALAGTTHWVREQVSNAIHTRKCNRSMAASCRTSRLTIGLVHACLGLRFSSPN